MSARGSRGRGTEPSRGRGQPQPGSGRGQPPSASGRGQQPQGAGRGAESPRGRGQPPAPGRGAAQRPTTSRLEEDFPKLGVSTPSRPAWGIQQPPKVEQPTTSTGLEEQMSKVILPAKETVEAQKPEQKAPQQQSVLISHEEEEFFGVSAPSIKTEFPPKPKIRGTEGRLIKLRTNHYAMKVKKQFTVFQYDVEMKRKASKIDADKLIKNKAIMREMFLALQSKLPNEYKNRMVFNFSKNLYSLIKLPFDETATYELIVEKSTFLVTLKRINQVTVDPSIYQELEIQILDLVMTHRLNYSCVNLNRSFFKEGTDFFELGFGLELWKGAYTSVRPSELGLTWNIDTANAAFFKCQDLLEVLCYHYDCGPERLNGAIQNDKNREGQIGASFLDTYKNRDIKTKTGGFRKKIRAFGPDSAYKFTWNKPDKTSVQISVRDYLKQHYKIDLKYPMLPCVDLGRQSYLPVELCSTELKNKKKLDDKETQAMIKHTAVPAPDRMKYIENWANRSDINKDPVLKEYNIEVGLRMVEVDGRVLDAPDVQYKDRKAESRQIADRGQWDHRGNKFFQTVDIKSWLVINLSGRVREDALNSFIDSFFNVGSKHGINFQDPIDVIYETRRMDDNAMKRSIENIFTKYKASNLNLIVVIFGGTTNAYKIVKTCGDLVYGIPTQGVEDRNVNKLSDQTISNILLKINSRVGGINFTLSRQNRLFGKHVQKLYDGPLMVFGADVTHPSPGEETDSIAAVVGSLDKECCYYAARLFAQRSKKGQAYEMIHDLDKMVLSLLQAYFAKNNAYPKKIVFYRDGVSEGQFPLVLRHEINKMRMACQQINPGYKPAITFVVVQKRHHTRLFPINRQDQNGCAMNVPPGTVVDRDIVSKNMFDFFLCSHVGIQGTSRPCRYFLLHDDNEFTMDQLQILSHYLCHVYARCPRSVSYPAPAYYSHLAAFRGRDYIRSQKPAKDPNALVVSDEIELHQNIRNKMFFI